MNVLESLRKAAATAPAAAVFVGGASLFLAAPVQADDQEIVIRIKDRHFVPDIVPAAAGQKIKLIVKNEDTMPSEFESVEFHREKVVPSGKEITVFVGPLEAGSYEFFDDFHPDSRGHLLVK